MPKRGPPKTPTNILELRGNPGKRKRPNEPKAELINNDKIQPPARLDRAAKVYFRKWHALAVKLRVLTEHDLDHLANVAARQSTLDRCNKVLNAPGKDGGPTYETITASGDVMIRKRPQCEVAASAFKDVRNGFNDFGFTPSGRASLTVAPPEKADPFKDYMKRKK